MPPRKRIIRRHSGWLAIPASLFLFMLAATAQPAGENNPLQASLPVDNVTNAALFPESADVVVLTFFDLYCLACQQSAETFNMLHQRLGEVFPDRKIHLAGVGIGDTALELDVFQRKYQLSYASLPDPEKTFAEPFLVRGTPTVLVFEAKAGSRTEIYRHEGRFRQTDIDRLIEKIRN